MSNKVLLEVWPAEFYLPSFDAECLQYIACVKLCDALVDIRCSAQPWFKPHGTYPVVVDSDGQSCYDFRSFVMLIDFNDDEASGNLAQVEALKSLCLMHLRPAYLYTLWLNESNVTAIVERWCCDTLGILYSNYYVSKMQRKTRSLLANYYGRFKSVADIDAQIVKKAKSCLRILSKRLGQQKFFFGNNPSSLDAFVFGYLAPFLYVPFPDDRLTLFIRSQCANLERFVFNIVNNHMPMSEEERDWHKSRMGLWEMYRNECVSNEQSADTSSSGRVYPLWEKVVFAIGAITLSVAFAIGCDILQVRVARPGSKL